MGIFNKIISGIIIAFVFVCGIFVNIDFSPNTGLLEWEVGISQIHANGENSAINPSTEGVTDKAKDPATDIPKILNSILGIIMIIVSPIIMLAGWLMSPDWVTGDIFDLRQKMHSLWITVSNILYFIYAIVLIIIAIATIFNYQPYAYKTMLPRLFIGIILIPLTFWFVQFIISASTVVTATVLKIPQEMMQKENKEGTFWTNPTIPKVIELTATESQSTTNTQGINKCENNKTLNQDCTSAEKILSSGVGIYSPIFIYAYKIFEIQNFKQLPTQDGGSTVDAVSNVTSLVNKLIFNAILFLIFGVLTIAMVFILFVRGIKLWMYIIFSPLFTAKIVFKDWKEGGGEMFDIKEFIGLAFVPAVMGLALSFGLIVVSAVQTGISTSTTGNCDMTQGEGCVLMTLLGNPQNEIRTKIEGGNPNTTSGVTTTGATSVTTVTFGELKFRYTGSLKAGAPINVSNGGFMGSFSTVIVQFIALIFIWVAFIAAAKINKGVQTIIAPFENFGRGMADLAKSSVKAVPMPLVGNVAGMEKAQRELERITYTKQQQAYDNSTIGKIMKEKMGGPVTYNNTINVKADMKQKEGQRLMGDNHTKLQQASHSVKTVIDTNTKDGKVNFEAIKGELGGYIKGLLEASKDDNGQIDKKTLQEALRRAGWEGTKFGETITNSHFKGEDYILQQLAQDNALKQNIVDEFSQLDKRLPSS